MSMFLTLAYLFFIGSVIGWHLEILYRNLTQKPEKLINPGFCTGPYLPIYGVGLCALYLLASLEKYNLFSSPLLSKIVLFLAMAAGMTLIEYAAGLFCLKSLKVRLWDYSEQWGNIQGIICPLFSFYWSLLGALYYFLIHPRVLKGLAWLSQNLAFSFFIGMFFGIFLIDVAYSAQLVLKLKQFAEKNDVIVRYEKIKLNISEKRNEQKMRFSFFRPFHSDKPLGEHLKEMKSTMEQRIRKK